MKSHHGNSVFVMAALSPNRQENTENEGGTRGEREEMKRRLNGAGGGVEEGRSRVSCVSSTYNKLI